MRFRYLQQEIGQRDVITELEYQTLPVEEIRKRLAWARSPIGRLFHWRVTRFERKETHQSTPEQRKVGAHKVKPA